MWWCYKGRHAMSGFGMLRESMPHQRFRDFLLCLISHNPPLLAFLWQKVGIIDADEDGGLCYWRLDFWNSNMKRQLRIMLRSRQLGVPHV